MPSSNRCVFGCLTTGVTIHKFPNPSKDPERFKAWVQSAAQNLTGMTDETIYKNRNVCDRHFADHVKNRNNRLNNLAVPTLHLSHAITDSMLNDINTNKMCTQQQQHQSNILKTPLQSTDTVLNDVDVCGQQHSSNVTKAPQCTDDALTAVNNDHTYCGIPGQPTSLKAPKTTGTRKLPRYPASFKSMHNEIKKIRSDLCRARKRCHNFKTRLVNAVKMSEGKALQKVIEKMNLPARLFTTMQFRECTKKPKGHRFTNEEKILSLSLYKRSPKSYALLSKCFTLPSAKSLKILLSKIKIKPGINKIIFEKLKHTVDDMSEDDRLCTIVFDEMSLRPQLQYNASQDEIKGFTTIGKIQIADHVLTFMVRGVKKNFKQPIAYYFTSRLNKIELKNCLKEVVEYVKSTGLNVVATVCDQSAINVGAIEGLIQEAKELYIKKGVQWRNDVLIIGGKKILPLYDVPHLIKGLRNNLLTKDAIYVDGEDGKNKTVKWEYFQKLYEADSSYGELKFLQKLTQEHIYPEKITKMKVKTATQVFSHSVAVATKHLVESGKLNTDCLQITPFVLILDKLFDSLNCSTFHIVNGKIYRAGVKVNSPHHKLWQDGIVFLKNMRFIEKKKEGDKIRLVEKVVPSINNFIKTLEGMQALWKILNGKYGCDIMLCRNFNQDPLENFFGSIRSLGARNVAPNTVGFEAAFKSLLLNNFCSSRSIKTNCEEDMSTFLQSVDFFLTKEVEESSEDTHNEIIINEEVLRDNQIQESQPMSYVCGWVLKKCCTKIIKGCMHCKKNLIAQKDLSSNSYIKAKEYQGKKWLCYPSEGMKQCFSNVQSSCINVLKQKLNPKNIKVNIRIFNEIFVNFDIFDCEIHKEKLKKYFENLVINVIVYSWCRSVNRILCGKLNYDGDDETKIKAQLYYNKHKHYKIQK